MAAAVEAADDFDAALVAAVVLLLVGETIALPVVVVVVFALGAGNAVVVAVDGLTVAAWVCFLFPWFLGDILCPPIEVIRSLPLW